MDLSDPARDLTPSQQVANLISEFTVRDADKFLEIAAAVQDRTAGEVNIQSEHLMKICPRSVEQEKLVRETWAGMQVEYDRSRVQIEGFIINGLLLNTPAAAVVAELQALGVTTSSVTQLRNGNSLLPLFVFKAPKSQSQALHLLKRLGDQEVQIQSYTDESATTEVENATGHFIINGLLPNTQATAVAAELQTLGVTTRSVTQIRNGNSLLPLFVFKAPKSQSQALHQLKRLGGREVQIQSYTNERASAKAENATGHFIIKGLLPNTQATAVAAELQALGVTTRSVTQLRNGNSLLPLFVFKAPTSLSQALHQLKILGGQQVQIQSYTAESAPAKAENATRHFIINGLLPNTQATAVAAELQALGVTTRSVTQLRNGNGLFPLFVFKAPTIQSQALHQLKILGGQQVQIQSYKAESAPAMTGNATRHFIINGLLPNTQATAVAAELQALGVSTGSVTKLRNGNSLLPLFFFKAPTSQSQALHQLTILGGQEVQIQSYTAESATSKAENVAGHNANNRSVNRQCQMNSKKKHLCQIYTQWNCRSAQESHHVGQQCSHESQMCNYSRAENSTLMHGTMFGHQASNCCPDSHCEHGWKGPGVQKCTKRCLNPAPMQTCRSGPRRRRPGPSSTDFSMLSVLRDLKDGVQKLKDLPQEMQSIFQTAPPADLPGGDQMAVGQDQ